MYYVYIIESIQDKKFYTGYTHDLRKRLWEHNNGLSSSTKWRRPFTLAYYEAYVNKEDAKEREKFFKTGWGRGYVKKVLRNYLRTKS